MRPRFPQTPAGLSPIHRISLHFQTPNQPFSLVTYFQSNQLALLVSIFLRIPS
ncbi:hypothetical protein PCASD_00227 [Puccinia coronata f. sp. avenae]|uniref:Uncharacterized protein n=1 Tax=Puccinia coronata f. sp. avenae TaxID=200324 RepID=A0A2N5VQK2_9BASI|nr:hypothetical protein PCASD_00227 [Puccinia coronata f. sp. avenae]